MMKLQRKPILLKDNTSAQHIDDSDSCSEELMYLSSQTIGNLKDEKGRNLLIFPHSFRDYGDEVDKQYVFSVGSKFTDGKIHVESISTGNMMGFIGLNGVEVSISSRFSDGAECDYFLMYMLKKVLSINVMNLKYGISQEKMFELLVFLLPVFLRRAMRQGVYRQYTRKHYNDANVRGAIDISRHLRQNVPFNYRIAYTTREFDADNPIMQLIRHTIEYIRGKNEYKHILTMDSDTDGWVKDIVSMTPSYNARLRNQVIKANLRPLVHPYYTEYTALQKLCLKILRYEKSSYGASDNKIYGILFDGAWLWEEYLATILMPIGYKHPRNKKGEGRIYLCNGGLYPRYPDFYKNEEHGIVLDAKYKRDFDSRDDINQLLTYMYRLKSRYGAFILPGNTEKDGKRDFVNLLGYGGFQGAFRMMIPSQNDVKDFSEYIELMERNERMFLKDIRIVENQATGDETYE